jgi:hypothetical protein
MPNSRILSHARVMLNHIEYGAAPSANHAQRRFLASSAGAMNELKQLLDGGADKVDARVGAQIAQMLRAIRETASGFGLSDVARAAARIEEILVLREAYGASGKLILSPKLAEMFEEMSRHIARAAIPLSNSN